MPEGNHPKWALKQGQRMNGQEGAAMSVVRKNEDVVFTGTPTSCKERVLLRDAGFVHVTGLTTHDPISSNRRYIIGEKLTEGSFGKWDHNTGVTVIVTTGGEIWISAGSIQDNLDELKERFAPNGQGAFVPCSNGEMLTTYSFLCRVSDPDDDLHR